MPPVGSIDLRWRYRVRIGVFLLFAALAALASSTVWRTVATLRRLEVVEAERDLWQRPDQVARALELEAGQTVVDLGCGAGYFSFKLSAAVGPAGRVVAVDVRSLPLMFLRLRALLGNRHNLKIVQGEPDDPHLTAGSADAVLIANTWHELGDRPRILARLRAALHPGGRLVVVDPGPAGREERGERHVSSASAAAELQRAGFEILVTQDRFVERSDGTSWWLVAACRPGLRGRSGRN